MLGGHYCHIFIVAFQTAGKGIIVKKEVGCCSFSC
ncbi:hypothetical protein PARMER_04137 [Parabacteroides merdae ATCC 43184]|nr:hypothetical protein PARMER_04137 [Parabacteroides merdae ATCC 43184]